MKKIAVAIAVVGLICPSIFAKDKFAVSLSASTMSQSDAAFKEIYSKSVFFPELMVSYKFYKDFYAYAGYGLFKKKGLTPELQAEAKTDQRFLSFGAGIIRKLGKKFEYFGSLGLTPITYREDALEEVVKDSALGFRLDAGIVYNIISKLSAGLTIGLITAKDTIEDVTVKLGGFKIGLLVRYKI